jgi:hypothetical protein
MLLQAIACCKRTNRGCGMEPTEILPGLLDECNGEGDSLAALRFKRQAVASKTENNPVREIDHERRPQITDERDSQHRAECGTEQQSFHPIAHEFILIKRALAVAAQSLFH